MLYSLDTFKIFLVLLVGCFLAWTVHVAGQRLVQHLIPETKWYLQRRAGATSLVDPFAAVAALLGPAAVAWTPPVEWSSHKGSKRRLVTLLLAGPVANLLAGVVLLEGLNLWVGKVSLRGAVDTYGQNFLGYFVDLAKLFDHASFGQSALFLLGIQQLLTGVISLIPLPPLEGGRLLFLFTPRTAGWQKAEYTLVERNVGLIIVLVGLIRISSGLTPPFAYLGDVIAHGLALLVSHI